jgi:RHS repeat-associated protein
MCEVIQCLQTDISREQFTEAPEDDFDLWSAGVERIVEWKRTVLARLSDHWCGPVVEKPQCELRWDCGGRGGKQGLNGPDINFTGNAQVRVPIPAVAGDLGDRVELTYNSANAGVASAFGQGWKSNLSRKITDLGGGSVKLTRGDGTELTYTGNPAVGSLYTAPDGATTSLKRLASGWEETIRSGGKRTYNSSGNFTSASSSLGTWTISYSGGLIDKLMDPTAGITTFTYASGKISKIKDRAGRETSFTVNAQGDLADFTTPELCTTTLKYDASHRLTDWVTPAGVLTSYSYDASNRITGIIGADNTSTAFNSRPRTTISYAANEMAIQDARGFRTTYALDASSRLSAQIRPDGTRTTYSWQNNWPRTIQGGAGLVFTYTYQALTVDPSLRMLYSVQNPTGNRVTYQLDSSDRLQAIVQPDGIRATISWDGNRIASFQDALDRRFTYSYTAGRKQLERAEQPGGSRFTLSYDAKGQLAGIQNGVGARSTLSYNAAGYPTAITNPLNLCTTFQRDDVNRVVSAENMYGSRLSLTYEVGTRSLKTAVYPTGNCTTFLYNNAGRLKEIQSASDGRVSFLYDTVGNWRDGISGVGDCTTYSYDTRNRRTAITTPFNGRSTTVFDSGDRKAATVSSSGARSTNVYDAQNGRLLAMIDPFGYRTSYVYDAVGRRIAVQDALGNRSSTVYDVIDRPIVSIDPLNRRSTTVYDVVGRVQAKVNPLGERTTYVYDAVNRPVSVMNPLAFVSTTVYDLSGNVIANVDPLGNRTSFAYDLSGRRITVINPLGVRSTTIFDSAGRVSATVDPVGSRTTNSYDAGNRLIQITNGSGFLITQVYDTSNRLIGTVDPLGNRTSTTYAISSRYMVTSDPLNRRTTQSYDTSGRVIATADPLGFRTTTTYDAAGRSWYVQNARSFITTSVYDALGRLRANVDALGNRTTFAYDVARQQVSVTDPMGRVTSSVYDGAGRSQASVDMLGQRNTAVYDAAGQSIASVNALGQRATTVYDRGGRVSAIVNPLGFRTSFSYDAASRQVEVKDARGHVSTQVYDAADRGIAAVDALGNRTTSQYDALGLVTKVTNAQGYSKTMSYDVVGRMRSQMDPLGRIVTMSYTNAGELLETLDARGIRTTNTYDLPHRIIRRRYPSDAPVTISYDGVGNQTQIKDAAGTWDFGYDGRNLMTSVRDPASIRLTYTYNATGQRTLIQTPVGNFTYSYDAVGRMSSLINPEAFRTSYSYDAANRETKKELGNNTLATTEYDAAGNVKTVTNKQTGGTVITSHEYLYDGVGNRTQVTENGGATVKWGYDATNRLTSEIRTGASGFATTYTYDGVGNRLTQRKNGLTTTYTYDRADQLTISRDASGITTYSYDAAGNQTLVVTPSRQRYTSTWNNQNQRAKVVEPDGTITSAVYRFDGLRYKREESSVTKKFVYDGQNYLLETDATNGITLALTNKPEAYGNLVSQRVKLAPTTWATVFHHFDALGSTAAITSESAATANTYLYNAWGEVISSSEGIFNNFKWHGELGYYFEDEGALDKYYVRARYYDIATGIWLSQDRLFIGQTVGRTTYFHLYEYAGLSPLVNLDPSGLLEWRHRVESGPDLDAEWGFQVKIRQTLIDNPASTAAAGTQTWQTNDVRSFGLVSRDDPPGCQWIRERLRLLDVNDIGGRTTPIPITDTIAVAQKPNTEPISYCGFIQITKKQLGFRPFTITNGTVTFTGKRLRVGNPYEATDDEWKLAQTMSPPFLEAEVKYAFFDRDNCCRCSKAEMEQLNRVLLSLGVKINSTTKAVETLSYGDLVNSLAVVGGLG